jgi:outer membrane protein OmpA-like peptidoglycan-associated protein
MAFFGLAAGSQTAFGESLTDEEILQRFLVQRDAYADEAAVKGGGKKRGLTIVTVEELGGTATGDGTTVAESGETGDETTGTSDTIVVADAPELGDGGEGGESGVTLTETPVDPVPGGDAPEVILASDADSPVDPTQVGILPEELQVNVRITFDYDSATIKADQTPVLEQMCRVMKASDIKKFRIMGHTDSAGSDAYNDKLSLLRAEEVKRRLVSDCGLEASRLEAMGLGERFLFDTQDPASGDNRRVEFQALS